MLFARPKLCAQMHCDKHVVKMILEYAQILCTTHRILDKLDDNDTTVIYYKKTHVNHPSVKWARETKGNYTFGYTSYLQIYVMNIHIATKKYTYVTLNYVIY